MIKRCIAYGAAMLVILYTFLIYDAEVLSAILILSILYPILSLSWLAPVSYTHLTLPTTERV